MDRFGERSGVVSLQEAQKQTGEAVRHPVPRMDFTIVASSSGQL